MIMTTFYTLAELTSLRANGSDRFSDGLRHPYPGTNTPITRLRFLGYQDGRYYYAAQEDVEAVMPPHASSPPTITRK